jgi:hypothetical protein
MLKRQARLARLAMACVLLLAGSGAALADDARNKPEEPPLDDELLEFLGSVDTASDTGQPDDGTWNKYLAKTDSGKVPVKPTSPAANPTVSAAKPAASLPAQQPAGAKQHE